MPLGTRDENEPRISIRGVEFPDAKLIEFDDVTGVGKIQLYPGGPILTMDGGKGSDEPRVQDDEDIVESVFDEVQDAVQELKDRG